MNRRILLFAIVALALMGGASLLLSQLNGRQTLSPPGVKTHPLASSIRLEADLPERVLDYTSSVLPVEKVVLEALPQDTSFGQRRYTAPDKFTTDLRVVLMGRDRTSMHKPQICLTGQGWRINEVASTETNLKVERPYPYDLPVVKLISNTTVSVDGQNQPWSSVYVYWYVADDAISASATGFQRMWWMATKLLRTGVLQRWAYVSCFSVCQPGQEAATFERMKSFITAAVPEFQLYPRPGSLTVTAAR